MTASKEGDTWGKMLAWELVLPPSRPDTLDLRRIADLLEPIDRALPVGVLGSTVEFRDLLHELRFSQICVLERNVAFFQAVSRQRLFNNPETLIEGNWLETLATFDGYFAVILSDLTSGNIPYDSRRGFYDAISQALSSGGLFIDKNLTNDAKLISLDEIRAKYAVAPPNLQVVNYFSCEAVFCSELQLERGVVDTSYIYSRLAESLGGRRFERLISGAQMITPVDCVWFYGLPWKQLRSEYCCHLTLQARHNLTRGQPYFNRGFQYVWRKD